MLGHFFLVRAGARIVQELRCRACEHLHRLSLAFHDKTKVGDSMYRVAYDSQAAQTLLNGAIVPMATNCFVLIGSVVIMARINPLLTLVTMAAAPIFLFIIRFFSRKIDRQSRHYHEHESALIATIQESLSSIRAIQAFTLEPLTGERFRGQSQDSLLANYRMTGTQLLYSACAGLAVSIGTAAVVWVAGHQVLSGKMQVGDILVFLAYLGMLYQPMNTFSQSAGVIHSASAQLKRVFEIIDSIPQIAERADAKPLASVRGQIEFRSVSFQYDAARPVLRDINFSVEAGQVVAIVGRTGAGKTSLASLLLRFYDPISGSILLDGHDLRDFPIAWLRQQIGVVLQDAILFSATIAENIGFGKPGASLQEIQAAAKRAQAHDFIVSLPNGYETILGERGVNLSGGQRQRLSIARAFLKDAPILILDEPTSSLDTQTEQALLASLRELMRGRTTFIIAHRLSTIRHADQIIALENGKIVEQGDHETLLRNESAYAKLYNSQWGDAAVAPVGS
jgi:ABC-type multidrug transport system fused ATPase/permease subunit